MITVRLDASGDYRVRWPSRQNEIIALGVAYVAYESSLPVIKQMALPSLTLVQDTVAAAQAEHIAAGSGEAARAAAAETYRQTMITVKTKLDAALLQLRARNISNQAFLEGWGIDTVISSTGISVRKPRTEREWVSFLSSYVAKETSLDAPSRLTDPPLAEMTALNTTLQAADVARKAGKDQREAAIEIRMVVANRLLDILQAAALMIVVTQYDGVVTNGLQKWGYEVLARTTPTNGSSEPVS